MKIGLISLVLIMALAGGISYIVKANTVNNNADSQKTDNTTKDDSKIIEEDGSILETNKENRSTINNIEVQIDEASAKDIVLSQVPQGDVLKISLGYEGNIPTYEIKATDGIYEYEFEINANDGTIIAQEKEMLDL